MILDASAGNRTMWAHKNSENIIYIDIERRLERKPTIFCSNEQTPFLSESFDTIFYDPPHSYGSKGHYHTYPCRSKEYLEKWHDQAIPRYYGWDRYKTRSQLITQLYFAEQEFYRILKPDGLLWLKWNEIKIRLYKILTIFNDWNILMKLFITSPFHTASEHKTYWLCMEKKNRSTKQTSL